MIDITRMLLFFKLDIMIKLPNCALGMSAALQLNLSRGTLADHVTLLRHSSSCNPSARRSPHYSCAYFNLYWVVRVNAGDCRTAVPRHSYGSTAAFLRQYRRSPMAVPRLSYGSTAATLLWDCPIMD